MGIVGFERADAVADVVDLDASQRAVLALPEGASAAVLGAPGSGKTTTIVELVADRVLGRGWSPDELVVLTPSRVTATRLRDRIALRLGVLDGGVATNGPLARTVPSLAFEIVRTAATLAGRPVPRLVTGAEQDADIAGLLQGEIEEGVDGYWPSSLAPEVRGMKAFRSELRELMARATEVGMTTVDLGAAGRPEWAAAARFIDSYRDSEQSGGRPHLDAAEITAFATAAIAAGTAGERVDRLRLVVLDDAQEATESALALLRALRERGVAVVAVGDPDVAANAFRGGEPDAFRDFTTTLILDTVHRHGGPLRELVSSTAARIGTAGAGRQRVASAAGGEASVAAIIADSPARQWTAIARELREAHLERGVPWSRLAVVVRSSGQIAGIRRRLALAEVPARASVGMVALRDDRAARALVDLVSVGVGRTPLDAEVAIALVSGPFGGLDRLGLRTLRLALRAEELAGGGNRAADELLVEALEAPGRLVTIDHRVGRRAARLADILAAVRERSAAGDSIEELLWLAWERSGLAPVWYERALGAGVTSAEANANLDGLVALFTSATRFVERQPGSSPRAFLEAVLDAEVPEDTLSPQPEDEAVLVTTPSGSVGLEFDTVVVADLQEGVWPNLRIRGSLLAPQELVRMARGIDSTSIDERKVVLDDELRMFALAVSRARHRVVLAAVADEDESASVLFRLLPADAPRIDASAAVPLTLRGITGRMRRELVTPGRTASDRAAAASGLARLAATEVPGADPASWHGLLPVSTEAPLYDDEERVPVSPSTLAGFEASPLDWFLSQVSGDSSSVAMGLGTILHWAMETATSSDVEALWAAVESRWSELFFESPWMGESLKRAARVLAGGIAAYLADVERDGRALVGSEARFELEVDRAIVRGSIDRVERLPSGEVVIVDLKTGNPITRQAEIDEHPQLMAYQLAYAEGVIDEYLAEFEEHRAGGAKLLYVKKGVRDKLYREAVQTALSAEQLEAFRVRIRLAADAMAQASFLGVLDLGDWRPGGSGELAIHRVKEVSSD